MNVFQCSDTSDATELFPPQHLLLKPIARLNISVQLPQLKVPGKTISNWEVMEKVKNMIKPEEFTVLKVSKSTLEFIRFEGEIENKSKLKMVISKLDMRTIKLSGFSDMLKVRAAEAKVSFPSRHDWDSYFRDAKNMNEMKPGERPDTIHITGLPCRWFSVKQGKYKDKPSEYIFRKVFETFGEVRCVDIPVIDPYRNKMKASISGIQTFTFGQDLSFEGYVQFKEYVCFVKAMNALRGMKLLYQEGDKAWTAHIKVNFDKTKHLSDPCIRRRRLEREKLIAEQQEKEEKERKEQELEEIRKEEERKKKLEEERELERKKVEKRKLKEERQKQREEKRKQKHLMMKKEEETRKMNLKIAVEERKLVIAQRKLESIRLLDELFERVKVLKQKEEVKRKEEKLLKKVKAEKKKKEDEIKKKEKEEKMKRERLQDKEKELRDKLVKKYKAIQEKQLEEHREKLRQTIEGKNVLKSVLASRVTASQGDNVSSAASSSEKDSSEESSGEEVAEKKSKLKGDTEENKHQVIYQYGHKLMCQENNYFGHYYRNPNTNFQRTHYPPYYQRYGRPSFPHQRGRWIPRGRRYYNYSGDRKTVPNAYYDSVHSVYEKYFQRLARREMFEGNNSNCSDLSSDSSDSGQSQQMKVKQKRTKQKSHKKSDTKKRKTKHEKT